MVFIGISKVFSTKDGRQYETIGAFFEDNASDSSSAKYFLTVDDFNPEAKKLYESLGYQCVGELPDFYKEGINCYLMMKRKG